ncbi:f-box and wd repeat domain-containing 7 [Anaeramoeba ignava]|uniref:F-box and wd repeat domain-containing 7 n=1 Tax=Anaeramoeba ignava TaxID=1746090 RepID=A0A9Q0LFH7_ANAIG|nr:f-box and wd repeat domain-containing 7 [Anaeramoeba ignava]
MGNSQNNLQDPLFINQNQIQIQIQSQKENQNQNQNQIQMNFEKLPEEIFVYIFQYLNAENLLKMSLVSRYFNQISNDPYIWKCLFQQENPHLLKVLVAPPSLMTWKKYYYFRKNWKRKWYKQKFHITANIRYQAGVNRAKLTGIDGFATCNWDGTIKLWEISKKRKSYTFPLPHTGPVWTIDVNKLGTQLVSGGKDQQIHLYNIPSHKDIQKLYDQEEQNLKKNNDSINPDLNQQLQPQIYEGHHAPIACIKFDEEKILSGSYDADVRIWNKQTKETRSIIHHNDSVWALDYVGDRLITGSRDTALRWWNMTTEKEVDLLVGHESPVSTLQYDGDIIISGGYDNTCRVWDLRSSKRCVDVVQGHQGTVSYLQFDSDILVTCSFDSSIRVWDRRKLSAAPLQVFKEFQKQAWLLSVEFRDGVLLAASNAGEAKVFDFRNKQLLEVENSEMLRKWQNN